MAVIKRMRKFFGLPGLSLLLAISACGCFMHSSAKPEAAQVPRELVKASHPVYLIEPPDILQIDLITAVPKPPYRIKPLDVLGISVENALPEAPISGAFTVDPGGTVYLGSKYGAISVAGMTLEEARAASEKYLVRALKNPFVNLSLVQTRAVQQVRGPHLVRADGTIGLGLYGSVRVVGMTVPQARKEIESHLREFLEDPEVSLDIVGYNSKIFYVVFDYGGAGQQIVRLPITGNETVLDGISQVNGLPTVADTKRIWVSRPSPDNCEPQVLPVDWRAIVEDGVTRTNYQILPGDRIIVRAKPLVETDVALARAISPIERLFGITLLGATTINTIKTNPNANNNNTVP